MGRANAKPQTASTHQNNSPTIRTRLTMNTRALNITIGLAALALLGNDPAWVCWIAGDDDGDTDRTHDRVGSRHDRDPRRRSSRHASKPSNGSA